MTNANTSAVPTRAHRHPSSRTTFSVEFVGMAPDEELLGLVRSFSAERRVPKPVRIERLPCQQRFRARIGARGRPFEHEDPLHALGAALALSVTGVMV